jgi:UDP-N-acetyl-D-galactosamine dehydrogenase
MSGYVASLIHNRLGKVGAGARILVLGLTFKEDIPDLRNTKTIDLVQALQRYGYEVDVADAMADPKDVKAFYGIDLVDVDAMVGAGVVGGVNGTGRYHCVVGMVGHQRYRNFESADLLNLLVPVGVDGSGVSGAGVVIADIKGMWRSYHFPAHAQVDYFTL